MRCANSSIRKDAPRVGKAYISLGTCYYFIRGPRGPRSPHGPRVVLGVLAVFSGILSILSILSVFLVPSALVALNVPIIRAIPIQLQRKQAMRILDCAEILECTCFCRWPAKLEPARRLARLLRTIQ